VVAAYAKLAWSSWNSPDSLLPVLDQARVEAAAAENSMRSIFQSLVSGGILGFPSPKGISVYIL
jgi:hypothetical protein